MGKDNIDVLFGDITTLNVDIIVNAGNKSLLGGSGVDGAIHRKAGKELLEECKKLNGCETGDAKMTNAYNLPCSKIIHTVGPIYCLDKLKAAELLKKCYISCMYLAEEYRKSTNKNKITIAFPCIATGIYGYPKEEASEIAINTIKEINNENIDVKFVCYDEYNYEIYSQKLNNNKELIKTK